MFIYREIINSYKEKTKEDIIIGEICSKYINKSNTQTILDVGANNGTVANVISKNNINLEFTLIDIENIKKVESSKTMKFIKSDISDYTSDEKYDCVIISHIMTDIEPLKRKYIVEKIQTMSSKRIIYVGNLLQDNFKEIQKTIWEESNDHKYNLNISHLFKKEEYSSNISFFSVDLLLSKFDLYEHLQLFTCSKIPCKISKKINSLIESLPKIGSKFLLQIPQMVNFYEKI